MKSIFQKLINWLYVNYVEKDPKVVLFDRTMESKYKFNEEDEYLFVEKILSKREIRELLEKYIQWRVSVDEGNAMRSPDDRNTLVYKERAFGVGQITIDWKHLWERVNAREAKSSIPPK